MVLARNVRPTPLLALRASNRATLDIFESAGAVNELAIAPSAARYNRGMRFRKLRIAWSVVCGVACVLLIVLWVRSHSKWDRLFYHLPSGGTAGFSSWDGNIIVGVEYSRGASYSRGFEFESQLTSQWQLDPSERGFLFMRDSSEFAVGMPHWFPIILSAVIAAVPWAKQRFSLRTLLIATTLVAVVLGLIAWSMR
jgi:hypothetical protein